MRRTQVDITRDSLKRRADVLAMLKSEPASVVAARFGVTASWIYQVAKNAAASESRFSTHLRGLSVRALNALNHVGVSLQSGTVDDVRTAVAKMRPGRPRNCGAATMAELRDWLREK